MRSTNPSEITMQIADINPVPPPSEQEEAGTEYSIGNEQFT